MQRLTLPTWNTHCYSCEKPTLFVNKYKCEHIDDRDEVFIFTLLICDSCSSPLLVCQEAEQQGESEWRISEPDQLWPPSLCELGVGVPRSVRRAFEEAAHCFERARAYTATAIMCRRALEAVCDHCNVKVKNNLRASLDRLRQGGMIDESLFKWAAELHALGNIAAHEADALLSRQDAADALHFTNALLSYIFTYRQEFEEFKSRRQVQSSAGSAHQP
jgi:hypothetical protein